MQCAKPDVDLTICALQVAIRTSYFTWINVTLITLSIACWFPALYGFSHIGPLQRTLTDMVELGPHLFSTPAFWLGVILFAPTVALLLDLILNAAARQSAPLDRHIFQVRQAQAIELTHVQNSVPSCDMIAECFKKSQNLLQVLRQ